MSLDDEGALQLPSVIAAPTQAEKIIQQLRAAGPDYEKRIEAIKERKKEEAQRRERERKEKFERREI